jgi:hypothetical protein
MGLRRGVPAAHGPAIAPRVPNTATSGVAASAGRHPESDRERCAGWAVTRRYDSQRVSRQKTDDKEQPQATAGQHVARAAHAVFALMCASPPPTRAWRDTHLIATVGGALNGNTACGNGRCAKPARCRRRVGFRVLGRAVRGRDAAPEPHGWVHASRPATRNSARRRRISPAVALRRPDAHQRSFAEARPDVHLWHLLAGVTSS